MTKFIILLLLLALAACDESPAVKQARWVAFCQQHEFSEKQCLVLYSLKTEIAKEKSDAESYGFMTGAAMGSGR